ELGTNTTLARVAMRQENVSSLILIGLGANLPSSVGIPRRTILQALDHLNHRGVHTVQCSRFWRTRPVPDDGSPWYSNAVAVVEPELGPAPLLDLMLATETVFGRVRDGARNAPRTLDLDLLAYGRRVMPGPEAPILPHPRLHERAFVLFPLRDIAPNWRHP